MPQPCFSIPQLNNYETVFKTEWNKQLEMLAKAAMQQNINNFSSDLN